MVWGALVLLLHFDGGDGPRPAPSPRHRKDPEAEAADETCAPDGRDWRDDPDTLERMLDRLRRLE